jgi:hypothetical protein
MKSKNKLLTLGLALLLPITAVAGLLETCVSKNYGPTVTPCILVETTCYGCGQLSVFGLRLCEDAWTWCSPGSGTTSAITADASSACDADCGCLNAWGPTTWGTTPNSC